MPYLILILLSILADQALKFWVLANIPLYESIPFLPGIMRLTYIQNTGAAFSFLSGQTGFLTLISLVMSLFLAYLLVTKYFSHPFGLTSLALVLGGAVGNLIDRAFRGFVVDMFQTEFIRFAIFNIADVCVVVGGIGCAIYYGFFYETIDGTGDQPPSPDREENSEANSQANSEANPETSSEENPETKITENEESR